MHLSPRQQQSRTASNLEARHSHSKLTYPMDARFFVADTEGRATKQTHSSKSHNHKLDITKMARSN